MAKADPDAARGHSLAVHELPDGSDVETTETSRLLGSTDETLARDDASSRDATWRGSEEVDGLPWWRTPSFVWLLVPFVIFTIAFGGIVVPRVNLIIDLVCQKHYADQELLNPSLHYIPVELGGDNPQCEAPDVQSKASNFYMATNIVSGLLSAIIAPKLGHMSDRYGRSKLLGVASLGGIVNEAITIMAARFPTVVDYRWIILGSICDGLTGSFTAGMLLSQAYTADCTPPSKRAAATGYMHACIFGGIALGPILSGYLVKWTGALLSSFYVAICFHFVFMIVVAFVIPESVSKKRRRVAMEIWEREREEIAGGESNWWSTLVKVNPFVPLRILWPTGKGTSARLRLNLIALAVNDFICLGCAVAVGSVVLFYVRKFFSWDNFEASLFVSVVNIVRVMGLVLVFPLINYFFRVRPAARQRRRSGGLVLPEKNAGADELDLWVLRLALASDLLGALGYTLSRTEALFYASGMLTSLGGLGSATIQAVLTKHVAAERVGQLLGAMGFLHALARVIGPIMFNGLYSLTNGTFQQAPFVLLTAMFGIGFGFSFAITPHTFYDEETSEESQPLSSAHLAFNDRSDRLPVEEEPVIM